MTRILAIALALVLSVVGLEWHGHHRGYGEGVADTHKAADKQVNAAKADAEAATEERDAARQSLDRIKQVLKAKKDELDLANFYANAAMSARDKLQKQLTAANAARDAANRKAAHDSPDCAALARLPVCPAVSDRLWPQADDSAGVRH